jgi:hypothetical protein
VSGYLRTLSLLLAAVGAVASAGCLAVAAGAAAGGGAVTYFYVRGRVSQEYVATFADTWRATLDAVREQGLPLVSNENDGKSGKITSRTADGSTITIDLDTVPSRIPAEGSVTSVCVRVGAFGDQAVSERFLAAVSAHLVPVGAGPIPGTGPTVPGGPIRPVAAAGPTETSPPPELPREPVPAPKR